MAQWGVLRGWERRGLLGQAWMEQIGSRSSRAWLLRLEGPKETQAERVGLGKSGSRREGPADLIGPDVKSMPSGLTLTLSQIPGFEVINNLP